MHKDKSQGTENINPCHNRHELGMYIENKYWNNYIGDTDGRLNLIAFLEKQDSDIISFSETVKKIGL